MSGIIGISPDMRSGIVGGYHSGATIQSSLLSYPRTEHWWTQTATYFMIGGAGSGTSGAVGTPMLVGVQGGLDKDSLGNQLNEIGLDYEEVIVKSDVMTNYKEIEITVDNIEELVDNEEEYHQLTDEDLCSFLLNETLCEGLIYTQRIYD